MFKKGNLERKMNIFLYFAIFCIIFFLSCITPLMADDYTYAFSWATQERMTSVAQIIPSMISHRFGVNGRVFSHAMVQFFMIFPKVFFNIANAANCVLLMYLFSQYVDKERERERVIGEIPLYCCVQP